MYEALYNKYRPHSFEDVAGQEHITETLKMQVRTGRLSHAYLFIGTRGTGKTTCARILAKAVNCEHPVDGNPCNECASCRGIDEGTILDVTELDAASNNGVDDVRLLRDEAVFSPASAKKRVYIIDEVHMLSKPAFNALLKILEEPPEHLMFILATTELNKVLPTILSRCQRHSFRRLDAAVVAKRLAWIAQQEKIELTADAALLLGRLADGGMRDGISLLDQCSSKPLVDSAAVLSAMGLAGGLLTAELAERLAAHDAAGALQLFRRLWQEGKDPASLLSELAGLFRDALMLHLAPHGGETMLSGVFAREALEKISLGAPELLASLNLVQKYQAALRDAPSPRLPCELCLIELCGIHAGAAAAVVLPAAESPAPAAPRQSAPTPPFAPEPGQEAKPAPEPAPQPIQTPPPVQPEPASAPASASGAADAARDWAEVLARLEKSAPGLYNLLSDECAVHGRVQGGELLLELMPGFHFNMVSQSANQELLRRCSGLGVHAEEMKAPAAVNHDKLDALEKFGNVTFR